MLLNPPAMLRKANTNSHAWFNHLYGRCRMVRCRGQQSPWTTSYVGSAGAPGLLGDGQGFLGLSSDNMAFGFLKNVQPITITYIKLLHEKRTQDINLP